MQYSTHIHGMHKGKDIMREGPVIYRKLVYNGAQKFPFDG